MTEPGWSYGGDLSPCSLLAAWSSSIRLVYRQRWWWLEGWRGGAGKKGEAGSCSRHVCISKTRREDDKRITVGIFSLLKDTCVMLPHIVTFTDQCTSRKIISSASIFFLFLLFCSLTSPHYCFLYYFIAVRESLPLPPPLSLSSSYFVLSSFSIPHSLPLPIFACATFNCSDMPCGKLCLCVLEQALLVMAVIPDARGGV